MIATTAPSTSALRRRGFQGTIYSAAADRAAYLRLLADSRDDPRWIPLAREWVTGEPCGRQATPGGGSEDAGAARSGAARPDAAPDVPAGIAAVITSMGGTLQRRLPDGTDFGPEWFRECINSWRKTGCPVVSVSEVRPPDGIQWVRTEGRPSILRMLAGAAARPGEHLLLTNADILLTDRFFALLPELDPEVVYYANRVDVLREGRGPGSLTEKGVFALGYDCFLLPAAFVKAVIEERLLPEEYRIGEPWWDYALPLAAVARGFATKKLPWTLPLALHHVHPARYSLDAYYRNGQIFLEFCERLLGDRPANAAGLLGEALADRADFDGSLESVTKCIVEALP